MKALRTWFRQASASDRQQVSILIASMALYLFHITWFSTWQIEDAAITYAYARNFAAGDGLVTNVGGAWVEGFSNPTWTLLLAATTFLGLDPFAVAKLLGAGLGLATLPLAWLWARRLQPHSDGVWPAITPLALAMSTQFAMWSVAGLENALFSFLLAAGCLALLREGDAASIGWSGIPLGLLAFSRPEAPMYAGLITIVGGISAARRGGLRWVVSFVALSAGPFFAWHAWRFWAFGWEFPNTYYAKLGEKKFWPFRWSQRCWTYLRSWALNSGHIVLLPVFALGASGTRGWPARIGQGVVGILLLLLIPGITAHHDFFPDVEHWKEPVEMMYVRGPWMAFTLLVLLVLPLFREGRRNRLIAGMTIASVFGFAVYSGGDWMRGYRWLALCTVPLSVLLADAARTVALAIGPVRWFGPQRLPFLIACPVLLANIGQTIDVIQHLDTSPFDVRRRVLFTQSVRDRLHIDFVRNIEVDMGANLYWSGFEMLDLAGLTTVPVARHHYPLWFIDSYFRDEQRPNFAHLHGGWANKTRIFKRSWFRKNFVQIPGFGHSFAHYYHQGNYIDRGLLVDEIWEDGERQVELGRRVRLDDLRLPAPEVHPGGILYVELGFSVRRSPLPFRVVLFLHRDGRLVVRELPPVYDWLPNTKWRTQETLVSRFSLSLPDDLEPGDWDIGLVAYGENTTATFQPAVPAAKDPVYMQGEARWTGVVSVQSRESVEKLATIDLGRAVLAARSEHCDAADDAWAEARRHLAADDPWQSSARAAVDLERARCRARLAERDHDTPSIRIARQLAPRDPLVLRIAQNLADDWEQEGDRAEEAGDVEGTWAGWSRALVADPTRSWLRRRTELLRAERKDGKRKK